MKLKKFYFQFDTFRHLYTWGVDLMRTNVVKNNSIRLKNFWLLSNKRPGKYWCRTSLVERQSWVTRSRMKTKILVNYDICTYDCTCISVLTNIIWIVRIHNFKKIFEKVSFLTLADFPDLTPWLSNSKFQKRH